MNKGKPVPNKRSSRLFALRSFALFSRRQIGRQVTLSALAVALSACVASPTPTDSSSSISSAINSSTAISVASSSSSIATSQSSMADATAGLSGETLYHGSTMLCAACHGERGEGDSTGKNPIDIEQYNLANLADVISSTMPKHDSQLCTINCATKIADYMLSWKEASFETGVAAAVNIGGPAYLASDGTQYEADNYATGGTEATVTDNISQTSDVTLYKTYRWGQLINVEIPLNAGDYHITLHMSENYQTADNARTQNIFIEGAQVATALDIFKEVGHDAALTLYYPQITVDDGTLNIRLEVATADNASIHAIKVEHAAPPYAAIRNSSERVGPMPLRRLTLLEYNNTIRDLLGLEGDHATRFAFASDQQPTFHYPANTGAVQVFDMNKYGEAAAALASEASINALKPCNTTDTNCAQNFIQDFGRKAYRRPLTNDEQANLLALFEAGTSAPLNLSFDESLRLVVEAVLQAPAFIYHWQLGGTPANADGEYIALTPYELASRLSYFIWRSMPDDALLDSAASGALNSEAGLRQAATRLLNDPKAKSAMGHFFPYWLNIDKLVSVSKDANRYPQFNTSLKEAMLTETRLFAEDVIFNGQGTFSELFSRSHSFANGELASFYGITGVNGSEFTAVNLNPEQRSGILTLSAFTAMTGSAHGSLPPKRGAVIFEDVLCRSVKVPDDLEVPEPPDASQFNTTRERFEAHAELSCAKACHARFEPLGFAFENYGGIGDWRTTENGFLVDATGLVDLNGPTQFDNAVDLSAQLGNLPEAQSCFASQWMEYALARKDYQNLDTPSFIAAQDAFVASGGDIQALILDIVSTRSFRYRVPAVGETLQ